MNKRSTLLFIAAGLTAAIIIAAFLLGNNRTRESAGIIDKKYRITQQDYWNTLETGKRFDGSDADGYFKDSAANRHTLDFFSFLQDRFRDMEYEGHMKAVREYLRQTIRPPDRAEEMYELYARYTEYQKEAYMDRNLRAPGGAPEDMLENLRRIQDFRRRYFGEDTADAVFGVEVKSSEYALRKQIVIGDAGMSGKEKEERLASLRREMWGGQADTIDGRGTPLDRYNEKLKIYQAELAAMDEEERAGKISEFRREIFTPEEAARMDSADSQVRSIRERDRDYSRQSREILEDGSLPEQEKNRRIRELHKRLYGLH